MKFTGISTFPNDVKFSLSLPGLFSLSTVLLLIQANSLAVVTGVIIAIVILMMLTKGYKYNGKIGVTHLVLLALDLFMIFTILHI